MNSMSSYRLKNIMQIKAREKQYPPGTRVELIYMDDPYSKLEAGDQGTITAVDPLGDLEVTWDSGSTLKLIYGVDRFRVINNT